MILPISGQGSSAGAAEGNVGGPTAEHEGAALEVAQAAETSDASIPSASFQDHGTDGAPAFSGHVDFDAELDGHTDRALQHEVPSITGTATVALLASPPEGVKGRDFVQEFRNGLFSVSIVRFSRIANSMIRQ